VKLLTTVDLSKLLQGRVVFQDLRDPANPKVVKVVQVGAVPIQSPFSPDGRCVAVANTGTANASVIAVDYDDPREDPGRERGRRVQGRPRRRLRLQAGRRVPGLCDQHYPSKTSPKGHMVATYEQAAAL